MKMIQAFILVFNVTSVMGQIDSLVISNVQSWCLEPLDTSECIKGIEKAKELNSDNTYYMTHLGQFRVYPFDTKDYLLEYKYGLIPIGRNDILDSQNCCYMETFNQIIISRNGVEFMDEVALEADSLDKMNIGFKPPNFQTKDSNNFLNFIHRELEHLLEIESPEFYIVIELNIAIDGSIKASYFDPYTEKKIDNNITNKIQQVLNKAPNWTPAEFLNKKIEIKYLNFVASELLQKVHKKE